MRSHGEFRAVAQDAFCRASRGLSAALAFFAVAILTVLAYWLVAAHAPAGSDPAARAIALLVAALIVTTCGALALALRRHRVLRERVAHLESQIEEVADRHWELKEAEERAKSFLEAQGDVIVRRDIAGRITYANDVFCLLAGGSREALTGTTFALRVIEQGDVAVLPDGTRVHDQKVKTADGARSIAWREVTVRGDDAHSAEVQSVGRDVTERVRAERALWEARDQADGANRAKSRFLAMVSHEIRTPLNGILGMTDLMLDTPLTAEQATYAKAVRTSGNTLLSLIEEILDFSKIEAGKLDLDARPFALATMVEEIVELLAPRAQAKGIEIAAYIDERLPAEVVGDASRLRQVLLNLAGNAVKFTEQGGVSIIVEAGGEPDRPTFAVRDSGIGILPEARGRIFAEFEQAESGSTRKFGGTGLGLAIAKRIVERMGGRIGVESVPGVGSTFTFTIALPAAAGTGEPAFEAPDLAGSAILIVATRLVESSLIARRLTRWGGRTCVVADEKVALAILPERPWDTIIVDHALGREAAEAIVQACGRETFRRIVLLTPGERRELTHLQDAGFTSYLVQPVRAASLAARFHAGEQPCERGNGAARTNDAESGASPAETAAGLAILVAEDNEINALLARALLTRLGHRPTVAADGDAAFASWSAAQAAGEPYDLVLMDVSMPGCDGIEATRRIRAAEAESTAPRTRIVALTANAFAEDRDAYLAAGMDGFLVKPLDRERLAEALSEATAIAA